MPFDFGTPLASFRVSRRLRRRRRQLQKADILAGRRIFVNNYLAEHRRISVQSGGSSLPALSPVSHQSDD
uniref:SFRICE_007108 n=1 Tax=Spodoptera frugiperda TaxID=7108 RepID=A0A2H1W8Z8_SPOFR